jgi:uncharacterized membrane protein YidH (DUF202 family)
MSTPPLILFYYNVLRERLQEFLAVDERPVCPPSSFILTPEDIFLYTSLTGGDAAMDKKEDIVIVLAQEQTLLSRERTMHSYMQTGLAFSSAGLLIMKFLAGLFYFLVGAFFIILGVLLILEAGKRYLRFRKAIARLRRREAELGYDIGVIR